MMPLLRNRDEQERVLLETIVFNNVLLKAIPDQRKYIRDIKKLIKSDSYQSYCEDQKQWEETVHSELDTKEIRSKEDLDQFALEHTDIADKLNLSMERALLRMRSQKLKEKPSANVTKSIELMMDVDTRFFDHLDVEEKENLKAELDELIRIAQTFKELL